MTALMLPGKAGFCLPETSGFNPASGAPAHLGRGTVLSVLCYLCATSAGVVAVILFKRTCHRQCLWRKPQREGNML